jgi:cyclopropane fatty-acyl-phospholipid synthase-like methyltransferase
MEATKEAIKTMKLYHQVERVFNELEALGIKDNDPIKVEQLTPFDQYHYLGTDAVDESVHEIGLKKDMRVLEVGAGIGGPSRYLANSVGCHMTAMELQDDLNKTASALTKRCGLSDRVDHVCGDILEGAPNDEQFDALVSWLTFLHIPDRNRLYKECYKALKPGAGMYVEDYFASAPLTESEQKDLAVHVYCERVPSMDDYQIELTDTGFENIRLVDMSKTWTEFVVDRLQKFEAAHERNLNLHGVEIVEGLTEFYTTVVNLFKVGNLGGIKFTANKPS